MKRFIRNIPLLFACLFSWLALSGQVAKQDTRLPQVPLLVDTGMLRADLEFLSSDGLKGRITPGEGLDSAASYIASAFRDAGLKPLGQSYFQELAYCHYALGDSNSLWISDSKGRKDFKPEIDFMPYAFTGAGLVEGEVVFAGYGITAPEYGYDDYHGLDVKGRIVVVMRMEPGQANQTDESFKGSDLTWHATIRMKEYEARKRGAIALLVVTDPLRFLPFVPGRHSIPQTSEITVRELRPEGPCSRPQEMIPVVQIGDSVVASLFDSFNNFQFLQSAMEQNNVPNSFQLHGKRLRLGVSVKTTPIGGRNVIAWLPGSDPALKNQAVIIGAHYDHLGVDKRAVPGSDSIFNGADDNASGTSAMLSVARAFGKLNNAPARTLIFIAFAGEEQGLRGSNTFVKFPLWPLDSTVVMLNLDMVGRNDPAWLEIVGLTENKKLARIVRTQNKVSGFNLTKRGKKSSGGTSDHIPFQQAGIPALLFFSGYHRDYHRVTDEVEKIDFGKCARVAGLVFLTTSKVANDRRRFPVRAIMDDSPGNP